ncbi:MAG TPA: DUF1080 domain-containing protein [Urbifossiella sp.]|jgi:hypothetical protein|nr:DUF1080 domain-containing protein [Urbifossiella sp.]
MRAAPFALPALAGVLAALAPAGTAADAPKAPAGFVQLFNGKNLTGWKGHTDMKERATLPPEKLAALQATRSKTALEHWSVVDGAIHCDGKGGVSLVTEKDYANFELLLDWKIAAKGDSGLYLRGQPQVQIWDSGTSPGAQGVDRNSGSGGLWNNPLPPDAAKSKDADTIFKAGQKVGKIPLKKADRPVGEWNTFHITMVGDKVTVKLNGELVVDRAALPNYWFRDKPLPAAGPIELQFHGDPLWFRNISVKELPN